jgi:hypothetical protein
MWKMGERKKVKKSQGNEKKGKKRPNEDGD